MQEIEAPKLAAHYRMRSSSIRNCFSASPAIYNQRDTLKLDPRSQRLVEFYYEQFVHAGANLSDADKAKLKKLNEEESTLRTTFMNKAARRDQGRGLRDD